VELLPLASLGVHPPVVDAGPDDLDLARAGGELAGWRVAVAAHQPVAALVDQLSERGDVGIDLGLERRGQHPAGALAGQLVQAHRQLAPGSLVGAYTQHVAAFLPRRRWCAGVLPIWSGWKVRRVLMPGAHPQISTISPGRVESTVQLITS
jgi:hypothetical protein